MHPRGPATIRRDGCGEAGGHGGLGPGGASAALRPPAHQVEHQVEAAVEDRGGQQDARHHRRLDVQVSGEAEPRADEDEVPARQEGDPRQDDLRRQQGQPGGQGHRGLHHHPEADLQRVHGGVAPQVGGADGRSRRRRGREDGAAQGPAGGDQDGQDRGGRQQPDPGSTQPPEARDQPAAGRQGPEHGRGEQRRHGGGEDDVVLDAVDDAGMGQPRAAPRPQVEPGLAGVVDDVARIEAAHQDRRKESGDRAPEAPEDEDLRQGLRQVHDREDQVEPGGRRQRLDHLQPADLDHLVDHPGGDARREQAAGGAKSRPRPPAQAARQGPADGRKTVHRGMVDHGEIRPTRCGTAPRDARLQGRVPAAPSRCRPRRPVHLAGIARRDDVLYRQPR